MKLKVTTKIFPGKISNEGFSIFSWNDKLNTFTYRVLMKSYPGLVHRKVLKKKIGQFEIMFLTTG